MALGDLRDQILGAVDFFTGNSGKEPYPFEGENTITKIIPENWLKQFPYQFQVIKNNGLANKSLYFGDTTNDFFRSNEKTNSSRANLDTNFKPFTLQINPDNINQDEIFAINVLATQNGTVSEHNGIVFRDLQISGTTGIHPRRGTGGANRRGKAILGPKSIRSGYEEFHQLRNYFRAYAEAKRRGSAELQMIFWNRKDNEALIVEPIKFTMKRSAQRATLYDYSIVLKVIGNHNPNEISESDLLSKIDDGIARVQDITFQARGILLRGADLLRNVENSVDEILFGPLRQLDLALTELVNAPKQIGHMSNNLINRLGNSAVFNILSNASRAKKNLQAGLPPSSAQSDAAKLSGLATDSVVIPSNLTSASLQGGQAILALGALTLTELPLNDNLLSEDMNRDFQEEIQQSLELTISKIEELKENVINLGIKAAGTFNIGSSALDTFLGLSTPEVESIKVTTNDEYDLLYGLSLLEEGLNRLLAIGEPLLIKDQGLELQRINSLFEGELILSQANSTTSITLPPNTTLETLAVQFLGDAARWVDIVNINSLKPPYIDEDSTSLFVKRPGQTILIPSPDNVQGQVKTVYQSRYTENLTESERQMGVDILLNDEFDLVVGTDSDFVLATAGRNLKQAIRVKIALSKGDLMYHQGIGVGLIVGQKTPNPSDIAENIQSLILQDPRVQSIESLQLEVVNNAINLKMVIRARETNSPIPIELNL